MMTGTGSRVASLFVLTLALTACASGKSMGTEKTSSTNQLSAEEITRSGFSDAYSAIQTMRPQWLVVRGQTSLGARTRETIKVYLDGNRLGTVDNLRQIATNSIERMQRLDGIEASNRYGLDHGAGAILVFSRK